MSFRDKFRAAAGAEHRGFALLARAAAVFILALACAGVYLSKK